MSFLPFMPLFLFCFCVLRFCSVASSLEYWPSYGHVLSLESRSNCVVATIIVHRSIIYCWSLLSIWFVLRMDTYAVCGVFSIILFISIIWFLFLVASVLLWPYTFFFMKNFPHDKIKMVIGRCQQNVLCLLTSNFLPIFIHLIFFSSSVVCAVFGLFLYFSGFCCCSLFICTENVLITFIFCHVL